MQSSLLPATDSIPTHHSKRPFDNTSLPRTQYTYPAYLIITGQVHTDQTGQFQVPSTAGNKYVFVLYDYDSSYIDAIPIPY